MLLKLKVIHVLKSFLHSNNCVLYKFPSVNIGQLRSISKTMKAVVIQRTGDPTVLRVENVPIPDISPNQALVKIHAAGLNPVDTYIREKKFGYDPKLPAILGGEAAGEIVKVGNNTGNKYKVGDRVVCALRAPNYGGYAEFAACDVADLIPLSDKLTYSQGAAVFIPYFTAYKALIARCNVQPKELVMVHGASGGVGVAAVQISKAHGAVVAGSAGSEAGRKLLESLGADVVVDHREDGHLQKVLSKTGHQGFDVIFENRADINLGNDLAALGVNGRIAVVGSRGTVHVDPRNLIRTEGSVLGVNLQKTKPAKFLLHNQVVGSRGTVELDPRNFIRTDGLCLGVNLWKITKDEFAAFSSALVAGMEKGWLNPVVGKEYPMEEIQQAHRDLIKSHGAYGKLVLKVV